VDPELRVVPDVAAAALELFLQRDPRLVVLTGGGTPRRLYEKLAGTPYPWDEVELYLSDERCVPSDDGRSNERMIREALVSRVPATFRPMPGAACDPEPYEELLRRRFGDAPRFDLALYGLGPDGHTASLFPGLSEQGVMDRWVVRVAEAGWEPLVPRLSLTVPVLSAADVGVFLIEGEQKREPLRRLLAGEPIPASLMAPDRLVILADPAATGA
jgi:6-phosphogluconolactonase